jgi:hypothetical protein
VGTQRNMTKPNSRAYRAPAAAIRAALVELPADGCTLPVPDLPKSRDWTDVEQDRWAELCESPQATQWDDSCRDDILTRWLDDEGHTHMAWLPAVNVRRLTGSPAFSRSNRTHGRHSSL